RKLDSVSRGQGNGPRHPPRGTAPGPNRKEPAMRTTAVVTVEHVYALAEADFSDLPVLAVDIDGEIVIFPQCTAVERGARILTDAAALSEYTDGEGLDDTLAEQFAAEINEAYGLGEGSEDTDDTTGENPMRIVTPPPHPATLVAVDGDEVVTQPEASPVRIPATT